MNAEAAPASVVNSPRTSVPFSVSGPFKFRLGLFLFGMLLGLAGLWLLFPVLLHPSPIGFPSDRAGAAAAATYQVSALKAAEIGLIRGHLWADAAFADSRLLWRDRSAPLDRGTIERIARARSTMETALALAPVNAEGWLFLAALPSGPPASDSRVATLLELSYFTAPNALALAPWRLERAATSSALADKGIQDLVMSDIRRILTYRPQARSAIVAAHRNALPQNRPLFEALVGEVDSGFAQSLRAAQPK